nr:retrovirus-related Pol polyprotein from transposon TNT 1-94 [Tanacetum cinerariifolium]
MYRITKSKTQTPNSKTNIHASNSKGVESSSSVRRPKSKVTKSKNRVLKNTKSSSAYVWKISRSVSIDSNKCETTNLTVCQTNASVSNSMTVNAVNDGSNIVCVSCGKDVFLLSHENSVAHYALSRKSNVKRALSTTPVAAKSKNLGTTSVVVKSRLSVAKNPKEKNKYNKTSYELIQGQKPNIEYFLVLESLCYPTNDRDDLGKMKPNANIGIFIGYSESLRGFCMYNRRTKKIMETIHVKFDELTTTDSKCNKLEPEMNYINFQDSSKDSLSVPSKLDLGNLFGPLYEEYYETSSLEVSDNFVANTLNNENTSSSSSIVVEEDEAP